MLLRLLSRLSRVYNCMYEQLLVCLQKTDKTPLAQFYYADEALNDVAAELESFDGRKNPERCSELINKLRSCQVCAINFITVYSARVEDNSYVMRITIHCFQRYSVCDTTSF